MEQAPEIEVREQPALSQKLAIQALHLHTADSTRHCTLKVATPCTGTLPLASGCHYYTVTCYDGISCVSVFSIMAGAGEVGERD